LPALPKRDRGGHSKDGLDERAKEQPQASLGTDAVTDAADECAEKKSGERGEGLLVCDVEGGVAVCRRALEEAGKRKGQLDNPQSSSVNGC